MIIIVDVNTALVIKMWRRNMYNDDTIAAIATALTPSGIGIIRISGSKSLDVIDKIFCAKKNCKKISEQKTYTAHYGYIMDDDKIIDEVVVLLMRSPNSYTTEDTVEINCHGGIFVMKKILEKVIKSGARPAEPGEFTKRAFLNGRIDLSQAESVIDVINSENEYALQNSISNLNGKLLEKVKELRGKILNETAFIETAIDDPEHYSLDEYPLKLKKIVEDVLRDVKKILNTFENGKILKEGIKTVIVGKPNAGKSTLLNSLIGQDKAIVTDIPGTTRDIIEENVVFDGISLNIIDTAGIRETKDIIEKIGVDKTRQNIENADLIIYVVDSATMLDENDYQIIDHIKNKNTIVLLNKSDLKKVIQEKTIEEKFKYVIKISAKEGMGIEDLISCIKKIFFNGEIKFNDEVAISNIRHKKNLEQTLKSLELVLSSIIDNMPEDFYSIDLMNSYKNLGSIIGESVEDDLVNEIFSKFCMGK